MKKIIILLSLLLVALSAVVGCSPGLGTSLSVPLIPVTESVEKTSIFRETVFIQPFLDQRSDQTIVVIGARKVKAEGDVAAAARSGFEDWLRARGGHVSISAPVRIQGRVLEWMGEISPGFPVSTMTVRSGIAFDIYTAQGTLTATRTYRGEVSAQDPAFTEQEIKERMAEGLSAAYEEALADPRFTELVQRAASLSSAPPLAVSASPTDRGSLR